MRRPDVLTTSPEAKHTQTLKPYIGVSGISREEEARLVSREFAMGLTPDSTHSGMAGVLVSEYTLHGRSEGFSRYPLIQEVPNLLRLAKNPSTLTMVHYGTRRKNSLADQAEKLFNTGNIYADDTCRAIQLNIGWPPVKQLEKMKSRMPDLKVVLTLTPEILTTGDPNQKRFDIHDRLKKYDGTMDYLLIDFSGSRGISVPSDDYASYYRAIVGKDFTQPVILAGGFDAQTVDNRLEALAQELGTKNWGIVASRRLRDTDNDRTNHIDLVAARNYIRKSITFFSTEYVEMVDITQDGES